MSIAKRQVAICVSIMASALAFAAVAHAADADNGERLARRWCATCHIVAKDQTMGSTQAPSFSGIAARPGFDVGQMALFLLNPHPKMPNMNLSRSEAADLAAYIATQAK